MPHTTGPTINSIHFLKQIHKTCMFGHFAHFSPKKYSVQKKNLIISSKNPEV